MNEHSISTILSANHPEQSRCEMLESMGLAPTIENAITLALALKAAAGDVSAAKLIREINEPGTIADSEPDLTPFTDEELRALIQALSEE